MKKHGFVLAASLFLGMLSCKQQENKDSKKESFFPALSFIKSQVAHIDTSLYSITKIAYQDTLHYDTTYLKREEFRDAAKDFLEIPDLSSPKIASHFTEERLFDETMNRVILSYKPKDPDKEEIQKEEVLITPGTATGDKVNSIIIDRVVNNRDGFLEKKMLWRVDKSFQVITTTQKPGEPEKTNIIEVIWNEDKDE